VNVVSPSMRDRVAGAVLLAVAAVWIILVYQTIEPSQGPVAGPRAFPLFFGLALAGMSLLLLLQGFLTPAARTVADAQTVPPGEISSVVATVGVLILYGILLEPLGFIPSTTIIVAAIMVFVLRIRAPLQIAAMSLGLAIGCYLVFGKLLGTYLPPGTIITIYF
jgi:putative tricarboxylic transport membrane protein